MTNSKNNASIIKGIRPSPPPPLNENDKSRFALVFPPPDMEKDHGTIGHGLVPYKKNRKGLPDSVTSSLSHNSASVEEGDAKKKLTREQQCFRAMTICQFIMIVFIFIFLMALAIGIVYIALTVKDAVDRADHAIHHNPVTNFVDRIKNFKTSVSQKIKGN